MKDVKAPILAWGGYLLALAASVTATKMVPGLVGHVFSLICAFIMAALILSFFMGLRSADNLLRVFALAGAMWLTFMLTLTMADYSAREIGHVESQHRQQTSRVSLGYPFSEKIEFSARYIG